MTAHARLEWFEELFRLAYPTSPADTPDQMLREIGRDLRPANTPGPLSGVLSPEAACQSVCERLAALPLWALEAIERSLADAGEPELACLIGAITADARRAGGSPGPWYQSFAADAGWPVKRTLPAHADCSPLDGEAIAANLLPGGSLADRMPGYEPRPGQLDMLRAIAGAFNAGRHLLVEAGTGVGKSLAYLLPAARWALLNDMPVVVSTSTRNLQMQLMAKDIPLVAAALDGDRSAGTLRTALLKGRSNYLCLRRFGALLDPAGRELERPHLRQFARAIAWSVQTADGDLESFASGYGIDAAFAAGLSSPADECAGRACRGGRRCFLRKARERAQKAHVVVANHALVFSELGMENPVLPPYAQVIFDEAHNLEETATRHFSIEVSPARLHALLRRLSRGHGAKAGGVLENLQRHAGQGALARDDETRKSIRRHLREVRAILSGLEEDARALFRALHDVIADGGEPRRFRGTAGLPEGGTPAAPQIADRGTFGDWPEHARTVLDAARAALGAKLRQAAANLETLAGVQAGGREGELGLYDDQTADLTGAAQALRAFALDLDFVLSGTEATHVFWVQRARGRSPHLGEAWAAPLSVGDWLAAEIYRRKTSVILCSATLRVGGSFVFMARRLGIDRLDEGQCGTCVAASPFDYSSQCAVLTATFLPEPGGAGEGAYVEQLGALLLDVCLTTRGRALVLFTSYDMLQQCARMLQHPLKHAGIRLLVQGEGGSRDQITSVFRDGGACVLFGTHSFWEGVDVVGDALSCVVVARLPFAAVNDPLVEARCERIDAGGGNSFREFTVPAAVVRFRQGFGRLIRHRQDRGVVIVADPRITTRSYGKWFRSSLPCAVEPVAGRDALLARVRAVLAD